MDTPVWQYFDDAAYLESHVAQDVGLLIFSNGKNDTDIGWPQAVRFVKALQRTRQPHVFVWGQQGHGQRAAMPMQGGERELPIDVRRRRPCRPFPNVIWMTRSGTET